MHWGLTLLLFFFLIQSNNAYIFPGFGLGLIISGAIRVHDDMLLAACKCKKSSKDPPFPFYLDLKESIFLFAIETASVAFWGLENISTS